MEKISFSQLSWNLKVPIVAAWIVGVIYAIYFVIGLIEGMTGVA